jgi:geranylgeranyl pyrophosphate synthase
MTSRADATDALLARVSSELAELTVPQHSASMPAAARVLRPGKMFRPRMTLGVAAALGLSRPDAAVRAAAAVELLHMSSLIHDDLMDDSPQRRGVPSLHVAASPAAAIAMGNLLVARAAGVAAELGPDCATVFSQAMEQLWEGQLAEPGLIDSTSAETHLRYIALKTAALVEAATAMGALSQCSTAEQTTQLGRFGRDVGMAFQVADDLLDHVGDPAALGKGVGGDLPRGVISLGAWHALDVHGGTPRTVDVSVLEGLAAGEASVSYVMTVIGGYLDSARRALHMAVTDGGAWEDARAMIAGMLERGSREDLRPLIAKGVSSWPT